MATNKNQTDGEKRALQRTSSVTTAVDKDSSTSNNPLHIVGTRVLTGKVDLAIACQKLKDPSHILLEIFATVMTAKPGAVPTETVLLLRNIKNGPVIQVSYYAMDTPLPPVLKNIRCTCRINFFKGIQAIKIQEVNNCNPAYIGRLSAISNQVFKDIIREQGD